MSASINPRDREKCPYVRKSERLFINDGRGPYWRGIREPRVDCLFVVKAVASCVIHVTEDKIQHIISNCKLDNPYSKVSSNRRYNFKDLKF